MNARTIGLAELKELLTEVINKTPNKRNETDCMGNLVNELGKPVSLIGAFLNKLGFSAYFMQQANLADIEQIIYYMGHNNVLLTDKAATLLIAAIEASNEYQPRFITTRPYPCYSTKKVLWKTVLLLLDDEEMIGRLATWDLNGDTVPDKIEPNLDDPDLSAILNAKNHIMYGPFLPFDEQTVWPGLVYEWDQKEEGELIDAES